MPRKSVFDLPFQDIYDAYIQKVAKKQITPETLDELLIWLTGYDQNTIHQYADTYGNFLKQCPHPNPLRTLIHGKICGVDLSLIEDPLTKEMRYMDKLVDDLTKKQTVSKVLEKYLKKGL